MALGHPGRARRFRQCPSETQQRLAHVYPVWVPAFAGTTIGMAWRLPKHRCVYDANPTKHYTSWKRSWCPEPESNRYEPFRVRRILSPLCLPISPPGPRQCFEKQNANAMSPYSTKTLRWRDGRKQRFQDSLRYSARKLTSNCGAKG